MEKITNFRIVFVTTKSYDIALQIAKILITENLAACASIIQNITSIFGWQGAIQERHEFMLMIKTAESKLEELEQRIIEIHHDEVPEIIAVSIDSSSNLYAQWVKQSLNIS